MNDALRTSLRQLRLSGMAETLDVRLQVSSVTSNTATSGHFKNSILIKPYSFVFARSFNL